MDGVRETPQPAADASAPEIASITYRSRARDRPGWRELDELTRAAQSRNRAMGLTGMLLYEDERFFQCIEGPPERLEAVWNSIQLDERHRDVEVLAMDLRDVRLFAGWDMRWIRRGVHEPAEAAGPGLAFLEPASPAAGLAQLLLDAGSDEVLAAVDARQPDTTLADLLDFVIEPAARALGDAWLRDDIDDLTLSAALGKLHFVIHARGRRSEGARGRGLCLLAVSSPREGHLSGAAAVAELHAEAGWTVDLRFPESLDEIEALVAAQPYDRIDIASSEAVPRHEVLEAAEGWAERITRASANPDIAVSFGGRVFWAAQGPAPGSNTGRFRRSAAALLR